MVKDNVVRLVDSNGEQVGEFDSQSQYIRSKKQDEFYRRNAETKEDFSSYNQDAGKFIWSYPAKVQEIIQSEDFTKADISMIFYLATFVNGKGYLAFDNNSVKLVKKDLQKAMGCSRNLFNRFYNKLVNHGILLPVTVGKEKVYKWNEAYNFYGITKGKAKPTELVRTYVHQIRFLYEDVKENGRKRYTATALYPIFALVPHLHRTSNIICKNPDEKDYDLIEYFSLLEIADLLDLKDSKRMSTSLSSILLDGQTTFRSVESKNEKYLQLNPRIFWRDVVPPDSRLVSEFNMIDYNRELRRKRRVENV